MALLDLINQSGLESLFLIGDPDQAIYEWRNATPECFIDKLNDKNWKTLPLTANFRSSQLICNATYAFAKSFTGDTADNIKGVGGFGWKTVIKLFEIIGPVSSIKELQTKVDDHLSNKKGDKSHLALLNRVKKTILENKSKFEKLLNNQKIIDFSMLETPYFVEVNNMIEEGLSTLIEFDEKNFKKIISVDCYLDGTEDDRRVKRSFLKEIMLLKQIVSRSNKFIDQNIPYEE